LLSRHFDFLNVVVGTFGERLAVNAKPLRLASSESACRNSVRCCRDRCAGCSRDRVFVVSAREYVGYLTQLAGNMRAVPFCT
jgi:hypothetical protein